MGAVSGLAAGVVRSNECTHTANAAFVHRLLRECVDDTPLMQQNFVGRSPDTACGIGPARCPAESSRWPKRGMPITSTDRSAAASTSGVSRSSPGNASGISLAL